MTRTRRMKYNDDSSQDTDNSTADNIIPSVSKVNSPIPLNLAFDIVKPNPKDSVGDNYIETRYSVEDEVDSREREVEKIELEIRELQLRKRLLELTPNSSNKVRRPRENTELSGSRSEDKTSVVTASHRYTNVLLSDEMQFKAQVDSVKALCMSVSLPKIEIMKFDGSPLKFWTFMKGFKVNIADRVNDDTQKLMYLIHYCEGIAKDAIEHCVLLPEKEGYTEAIKLLHERFGRPHDIVEAFLTELLSGSPLNQDDITGLQKLTRLMTNCKIALSQMGRNDDLNCSTNIKRIVKQLPRSMQFKWAEAADDILRKGLEPNFDDLLQFLEKKVSIATNTYGQLASGSYKTQTISNNRSASIRAKIHTSSIKGTVHCVICSEAHEVASCPQLLEVSHNEKLELLKKFKLCFNCLKPNHRATDCRQPVLCEIDGCKRRHHRILHNTEPDAKQACCNSTHTTGTYLGFVPVRLHGPTGYVDTYALLDNGSDSTLLLSDVAKQVGISGTVTRLNIFSVIGASSQNAELTNFEIESLDKTSRIKIEGAYTIDNLPIKRAEIPPTDFQERWKHLKGVQLPTIACDKVGLLLGVDVPEVHWVLDQRIGKPKQPYASLTMLGWALFGPTGQLNKTSVFMNCLKAKNSLEEDILKLFEHEFSENKYSDKVTMSLCDKTIMEITDKQTVLLDGHYQVPIPWKVDWHSLPRNKREIEKRLIYLRKRLLKDEQLRKQYTIILATHESKGYLSRVTQAIEEERYFIPHHPVFNPKKPGKVRIVFDCAAKLQNRSLNDCIYSGPDLTNDLVGVLLRFRKHKIGLSADIEEMFLQVHLPEKDTKAFSFLWYPDGNLDSPPEVYELHVHPFGATSSPFCATYALRRTATDHRDLFDEKTQSTLRENFYVDDCLVSVETIPEAAELANNLIRLVALGGFRLHKWVSNVNEALNDVPIGDRSNNLVRIPGSTERIQRTLGLCWHTQSDCFAFDVNLPERPITKRGILSCASSLYNPLGFLAPLSLTPKRILQQLCRKNYGWDEMIDEESRLSWEGCLEAKSSIQDGPTPPSSLTTVAPENPSNRLLPFIDDPDLCLKHSPDVSLLVDDDDVRSLIVTATAVETEDSRVHRSLPSVRFSGFDTPPDSRSNGLIYTFDSVSKATDENLMDLEQVISSPAVDDEYLLKTVNDSHVDTVVNIDLRCISPPDKILPTDSGELMSSKTSVMFSAETDLPSVSGVNDSAKSVILLHESSISCKATTQFSENTKLVSPVVASAKSSIDIKRETENQKDDCFIQYDDKKFKTTVSMSPLVGLDKQIQHPLPDFKDSRVAEEMTHRNIEWHHNTPYANHHRVWEKLIGSIRRLSSAVSMSYETLTTCLTEAERIPNDRPLLQTRTKWTQGRRDLQVRGPVLIIGDTGARNNWPKGLVVSFDPGGDGLWNQAKIRTWKGTIIRGICKICL
ncbi:unnamed protein product [Schistosoma mattheei]|uniref:CCHC-type domain-containing protein n=3 Tax=Schistosoma TaxID=6181 RepID=A0AA85BFX4_9TREM|nr:unnamed protein product [Schistosoma mattheei]